MTNNEDNIYNPSYIEGLFDRMSNSYERINLIFSLIDGASFISIKVKELF